ncbi:type IV secretion protein Rhs [Pseudomonas oryzihabitans]|nr:type IV secretion protein Rhs [Pseudomonas psychrotolerans]
MTTPRPPLGTLPITLAATQPDIRAVVQEFRTCLVDYRGFAEAWYGGVLDVEQKFTVGQEVVTRAKDSKRQVSLYATCPVDGKLTLIHCFEAARFVPIGNTPVSIVPVNEGQGPRRSGAAPAGAAQSAVIGADGTYTFAGCTPYQRYRVTFFPNVTGAQLETLYGSYQGVIDDLQAWLQQEWTQKHQPSWATYRSASAGGKVGLQLEAAWHGLLRSILNLWNDITQLFDVIAHPRKHLAKLQGLLDPQVLEQLYNAGKEQLHTALLIASDEPLLWIFLCALIAWVKLLPPTTAAEVVGALTGEVLLNVLIGVVLTGGLGLAVRLGGKLANVAEGGRALGLLQELAEALMQRCARHAKPHSEAAKPILAQGSAGLDASRKATVELKNGAAVEQIRADAAPYARGKRRKATRLSQEPRVDDVSTPARTPSGKPAEPAALTCTDGCPVSMVTGEELLTLTDAELDGPLPFAWTRLYRSSACDSDLGLGPGWSHALAHRLERQGEQLIWIDQENRRTPFPLPSQQRPAISNRLARAALYLGEQPDELILAQAGDSPRFYHFRRLELIAISDAYGNRLTVERDAQGRIQRLGNGLRALRLDYRQGRIAAVDFQVRQPGDHHEASWHSLQTLVRYRYAANGQLLAASNALDETERYVYDDRHVILERHLAGGAAFFWEWQGEGRDARCVRHWSSLGQLDSRYTWTDDGSVQITFSDGSQQHYTHDANARLVRQVDPDGAETQKTYDAQGQLLSERDPLGAQVRYEYDAAGQLLARYPAQDEPTYYSYCDGQLLSLTRGDATWRFEHNALGDLTARTDPDGHTTRYRYTAQGRLAAIEHPDGSCHSFTWNVAGQLIEEQLPDGGIRRYRYDALGRQTYRQQENGAITHYEWDALGRLRQLKLPGGASRAFTYNAYGKVTAERDELGRITRYEYANGLHLVTRRLNPDGSTLSYRYDHARLLLTDIENERGEHYRLDYHPNGLIRSETGFDGRTCSYAYDLAGNLSEKTEHGSDGSTLTTRYARDREGRLQRKVLPDGSQVDYAYDDLGRLIGVDDGQWPLAYRYDHQDRLIEEHQGWATFTYGYDARGQLSHSRLPDGNRLHYYHGAGGALAGIDLNGQPLTRHQHAPGGLELQRQQGALSSHYRHDDQGRLLAHRLENRAERLLERRYHYDASGNLLGIDDSRKGQTRYLYDPLDRLVAVRGELPESFAHDPAGTLLGSGEAGAIQGNRPLLHGDRHLDYDAHGNLVRERRGRAQALITHYRYDSQHRLIQATLPDGSEAHYRYDAFGRRIAKTVAGRTTEFLWQGDRLVAESGPDGYRSYLYEPGTFRPLALLVGEGPQAVTPYHYHLDHLGTPQELTDASGTLAWSARYRAYGNLARLDVEQIAQPLRFQGQYHDPETGLHYNRHRYYHPETGSFITPDPIRLAGGLNSYRYAPNPTGWVDPLGLANVRGQCPSGETGRQDTPPAVNTGEPGAPDPRLTAEQRRARIEELSEQNAKRRVYEIEKKYNMHTIGKHGPEVPDSVMRQRAIDGSDPITGRKGRINKSSQFKSWKIQLHTLNEALTRKVRNLPTSNGEDIRENPTLKMEYPNSGRGYKPNSKDRQNPKLNESMNRTEVKFDPNNPDHPFTAFPSE